MKAERSSATVLLWCVATGVLTSNAAYVVAGQTLAHVRVENRVVPVGFLAVLVAIIVASTSVAVRTSSTSPRDEGRDLRVAGLVAVGASFVAVALDAVDILGSGLAQREGVELALTLAAAVGMALGGISLGVLASVGLTHAPGALYARASRRAVVSAGSAAAIAILTWPRLTTSRYRLASHFRTGSLARLAAFESWVAPLAALALALLLRRRDRFAFLERPGRGVDGPHPVDGLAGMSPVERGPGSVPVVPHASARATVALVVAFGLAVLPNASLVSALWSSAGRPLLDLSLDVQVWYGCAAFLAALVVLAVGPTLRRRAPQLRATSLRAPAVRLYLLAASVELALLAVVRLAGRGDWRIMAVLSAATVTVEAIAAFAIVARISLRVRGTALAAGYTLGALTSLGEILGVLRLNEWTTVAAGALSVALLAYALIAPSPTAGTAVRVQGLGDEPPGPVA